MAVQGNAGDVLATSSGERLEQTTDKLTLKKFDPKIRKHVEFRDATSGLTDPSQFAGHVGDTAKPTAILLRNHGLAVELRIDRTHPVGRADRAGVAEVSYGKGRVVLLGFAAQFRAQPHATFKLLFNALHWSAAEKKN